MALKSAVRDVNQGKVRVELWNSGENEPFYVSSLITAPFYSRMMKEKPFIAFIEIKKYAITAKIVEIQTDAVVIEWSYDGPEKFSEIETHHPFMWEQAMTQATGSVTE